MSNKSKEIDIKIANLTNRWHDQYKTSWFKYNQDRWKVIKKYSIT